VNDHAGILIFGLAYGGDVRMVDVVLALSSCYEHFVCVHLYASSGRALRVFSNNDGRVDRIGQNGERRPKGGPSVSEGWEPMHLHPSPRPKQITHYIPHHATPQHPAHSHPPPSRTHRNPTPSKSIASTSSTLPSSPPSPRQEAA